MLKRFALMIVLTILALPGVQLRAVGGEVPNFQYTNVSPLPGAGVAVNSRGELDGRGAMQVNIPVAYTPGWGYISLSEFQGNHPCTGYNKFDNGSSVFALGFFSKRRVFMSGMQVSREWSEAKTLSGQVTLLDETIATPAVSVGMQDILRKEVDGRSPYIVATKCFGTGDYKLFATLGYGGGRFLDRPFAGVSVPLGGSLNFISEWDGFQINNGLGWRPGGRDGKFTIYTGYNGQTGVLLGGTLAYDFVR